MDKPISIAIRETTENLVNILNTSGLPLDVMAMILNDLSRNVTQQAEVQYQKDLKAQQTKET